MLHPLSPSFGPALVLTHKWMTPFESIGVNTARETVSLTQSVELYYALPSYHEDHPSTAVSILQEDSITSPSSDINCRIWCFHRFNYEASSLLWCGGVYALWEPTFRATCRFQLLCRNNPRARKIFRHWLADLRGDTSVTRIHTVRYIREDGIL